MNSKVFSLLRPVALAVASCIAALGLVLVGATAASATPILQATWSTTNHIYGTVTVTGSRFGYGDTIYLTYDMGGSNYLGVVTASPSTVICGRVDCSIRPGGYFTTTEAFIYCGNIPYKPYGLVLDAYDSNNSQSISIDVNTPCF